LVERRKVNNSLMIFSQDDFGVEYNRYLEEVVQALESDPQFREKLKNAEDADIRVSKCLLIWCNCKMIIGVDLISL
jgi:hypothetical protein